MIHPQDIKQLIEKSISESTAIISGDDGRHFTAIVISPEFEGKNRVQKQQVVYRAIETYIQDGTLHAISLKTFTPEEWQQQEKTHHG